jgi:hypothetical protein
MVVLLFFLFSFPFTLCIITPGLQRHREKYGQYLRIYFEISVFCFPSTNLSVFGFLKRRKKRKKSSDLWRAGRNVPGLREEQIEVGVPASTAADTILVLPPAVVNHVQIISGATAENGCLQAPKERLSVVQQGIALSTVDVIVTAPGRRVSSQGNVRIDFPDTSTIVAPSLRTRNEPRIDVDVEHKRRTIVSNLASTNGGRPDALGAFMAI